MLKNKIKRLQKDLMEIHPGPVITIPFKYTIKDWTIEDIRNVIFPEGREYFDPDDEVLRQKWDDTYWKKCEYLSLLTTDELKTLEKWMEQKEGISHA